MYVPLSVTISRDSFSSDNRSFIQITPTDGSLDVTTIESAFSRLHELRVPVRSGFRGRQSDDMPTFEWLLLTDGSTENPIEYVFGVNESLASEAEAVCRSLFPNSYEFTHRQTDPVLGLSPPTDADAADEALVPYESPQYSAIEFRGSADRREDWQTSLTPFESFTAAESTRLPLSDIVERLATTTIPAVVQILAQPTPNWKVHARDRIRRLERGRDTPAQRFFDDWIGDTVTEEISRSAQSRIDAIETKDATRSFVLNIRAVAIARPEQTSGQPLRSLRSTFTPLNGQYYRLEGAFLEDEDAAHVYDELTNRTVHQPDYERAATRLPWVANTSRAIVTDCSELPSFCLLDGASLTSDGIRALNPTPDERTAFPRPPHGMLDRYRRDGLTLGLPVTEDGDAESAAIALPPNLQSLDPAWFGRTRSGKSTSLITAMLDNHEATTGADILIDPKGDGMAIEYLRAHYARYSTLDNVYYFDCSETLPALSFFDIRDQLADGIDRTTAVEDVVDHYIEILVGIMGRERFERAVRSPDIIRYVLKSLFDPVHGSDSFSHREFQSAVAHLHETRDPPPVVDEDLQAMLGGVAANSKRSFDELMQGVANRIEKIPLDARLAQLFNHVHKDGDAAFDLREVIDEDAVVILDTGGLRPESRRVLTLVLLSSLWTALRRRTQQNERDAELPLVNLYLEEAAQLAESSLLANLLSQARSFGLSMTLAMQFPAQLQQANPRAYAELLNNISTVVTGNVAVDSDLGRRFATADMPPAAVQNRLRALRRGQWMVSLPAEFGQTEPRPFLLESGPLPAGDPDGCEPLSKARTTAFEAQVELATSRTHQESGLDVRLAGGGHTQRPSTSPGDRDPIDPTPEADVRMDSALPFTTRMPEMVTYATELHALVCSTCETRYDPTSNGMKNAIACCHRLDEVDRDDVPICGLSLNLTRNERLRSPYTDAQLRFLQAVYSAHQRRFDAELEYDLLSDSMIRLQEYVGITHEEVQELVEAEALSVDCKYPHKLYTVTAAGREAIAVRHREGIAHGHLKGDLTESSLHVAMVEVGRRYIEQAFVADDASAAVEAVSYYDVGDGRLDAVGLDETGSIVVTVEAERANHDKRRAVPSDYDKMAAENPEAAIWIVENRDGAHDVLDALNDPSEGEPRVEKTYSRNSPPSAFRIDQPGFSEIYTFRNLRAQLDD